MLDNYTETPGFIGQSYLLCCYGDYSILYDVCLESMRVFSWQKKTLISFCHHSL